MEWEFWDYECLPVAVSFLYIYKIAKDLKEYEALIEKENKAILEAVKSSKEAVKVMNSALRSIEKGEIKTETPYKLSKNLSDKHYLSVFVEPVSFFRWAEAQGHELPWQIKRPIEERENKVRRLNYKSHKVSAKYVKEKMNEPLWFICHGIMYLYGYLPTGNAEEDNKIVISDPDMKRIHTYLIDASKIRQITLFGEKIKPHDFIEWANQLNIEFPNSVEHGEKSKKLLPVEPKPLETRERQTLLKIIIGMAKDGYGYDAKASRNPFSKELEGILDALGIPVSDDTIRKWLKEAVELLPSDKQ